MSILSLSLGYDRLAHFRPVLISCPLDITELALLGSICILLRSTATFGAMVSQPF